MVYGAIPSTRHPKMPVIFKRKMPTTQQGIILADLSCARALVYCGQYINCLHITR